MKIGFIDLHIDEWHANNYPSWFAAAKRSSEFELGYAWEESPNPEGLPLADWCAKNGMKPAASIEEVVEKSDCLCVLAPSNPEAHARLAEIPLKSGKPLYIDKTFAPDKATAAAFFETARKYSTPLMSSSALRYGEELVSALAATFTKAPTHISTFGGGRTFHEYSIHQIEMVVTALGTGAESVTRIPDAAAEVYSVAYPGNERRAIITFTPFFPFSAYIANSETGTFIPTATNMFPHLLDSILEFYSTGIPQIREEETIEVAAIREAALKAQTNPGIEIKVP